MNGAETQSGENDALAWLTARQGGGATGADALAFFDWLPPAPLAGMTGRWQGSGFPTGHKMDGLLEAFGWYGKSFADADSVDPLLFRTKAGAVVALNSRFIPAGVLPALRNDNPALPLLRALMPAALVVLRTRKPTARLRMLEHRGVVSATMIYDFLPINDVFRVVDADTRLGLMDLRGMAQPFFFVLRRARRGSTSF